VTWALALLFACPLCAQRPISTSATIAVLAFLAVPFAIVALVVRAVRKAGS
jgi:hypothetical protein